MDTKYNLLAGTGIRPLARETEYQEWRLAVIDILGERGYWELMLKSDSDSEPSMDKAILEKLAKGRGPMGRLVDSNHRQMYATERDPAKLWTQLEARYAGKDEARILYLRGEL